MQIWYFYVIIHFKRGKYKLEVYERIKELRKKRGLSADIVAEAIGVSRATIYRYESPAIDNMPITVLEPLAKVLGCSPAYLMGWEGITIEENQLLYVYRELNTAGKQKLQERADELLELGYTEKRDIEKMA